MNVLTALTPVLMTTLLLSITSEDTSLLDVTVEEYLDEVSHTDSTGNNVIPDGIDDLMDCVFEEENSVSEEEYL